MSMGARTSDSLQALPMDMDSPPPPSSPLPVSPQGQPPLPKPTPKPSPKPVPEIRRRRAVPATHDSEGSLESVLWALLFGCGLCIITMGKAFAWLFRSLKRWLPGGRSSKN
jgi:hypothetical protein